MKQTVLNIKSLSCTGLFNSLLRLRCILTSSFKSFIVSCWFLNWLPSDIASSEGFSRYGTSIHYFQICWPISIIHFLYWLLAPPWLCSHWWHSGVCFIYSSNFWKLFFPKVGDKFCSNFDIVTHKSWFYHHLAAFKLTGMVYCNHTSSLILVNDPKYTHLLAIHLVNFPELFYIENISHS